MHAVKNNNKHYRKMKKTLLIAAAALAAGVISSEAQVYSQNIVGYVNVVTYPNSFNFIANQLVTADGNNINTVLANGNFISGGTGASQATAQSTLWIPQPGGGYFNLFYWSSNDLYVLNGNSPYGPSGWYDGNAVLATNLLSPGQAVFLQNSSPTAITNTLVGVVPTGSTTNSIRSGFNALSIVAPLGSTSLDSTNVSLPVSGDAVNQETAWFWVGNGNAGQSWKNAYYYTAAYLLSIDPTYVADGYVPGWYDDQGNNISGNAAYPYWPKVGQGFFLQFPGSNTQWISTFNVN